ncbi:MAG: glyceraldehyde 3-phosphate dehydrogenase NAD-binding domain-containing protein, partial [Pseudomonadota bacterium]
MAIRVAINGYGRIGRNVLCAVYEQKRKDIQIVAINGSGSPECNAHLTKYDTVHGRLAATVSHEQDVAGHHYLIVNNDKIHMFNERDPAKLPWDALNIDVVLECTGAFRTKEKCQP